MSPKIRPLLSPEFSFDQNDSFQFRWLADGAGEWIRTTDLRITNALLYQLSYTGNNALACRLQPNHNIHARNALAGWRLGHPENLELLRFYIFKLPRIDIEKMMMWRDIRIENYPTRFNRYLPEKTIIDQCFERIVDGRSRQMSASHIQWLVNLFCRHVLLTLKHQVGDLYPTRSG